MGGYGLPSFPRGCSRACFLMLANTIAIVMSVDRIPIAIDPTINAMTIAVLICRAFPELRRAWTQLLVVD